jgi:hypothetical protein
MARHGAAPQSVLNLRRRVPWRLFPVCGREQPASAVGRSPHPKSGEARVRSREKPASVSPGLPDQQADGRRGSHGAFPMCRIALPHPKSGEARLAVAHTSFRLPAVAVQASLLRSFGYSWFSVDGCGFPQNIQELVGSEVRSISVPSCHSSVGRWAVMTSVNPACFFVFRCYGRHRFSAGRRGLSASLVFSVAGPLVSCRAVRWFIVLSPVRCCFRVGSSTDMRRPILCAISQPP